MEKIMNYIKMECFIHRKNNNNKPLWTLFLDLLFWTFKNGEGYMF